MAFCHFLNKFFWSSEKFSDNFFSLMNWTYIYDQIDMNFGPTISLPHVKSHPLPFSFSLYLPKAAGMESVLRMV